MLGLCFYGLLVVGMFLDLFSFIVMYIFIILDILGMVSGGCFWSYPVPLLGLFLFM